MNLLIHVRRVGKDKHLLKTRINSMIQPMKTPKRALASVIAPAVAAVALLSTAEARVSQELETARTTAENAFIENIVPDIGVPLATRIGTGEIKFTKQNVKFLVQRVLREQIDAKAPLTPSNPLDPNRTDNQVDEIGEAAAFVLNGISINAKFSKLGVQKSFSLAILQAALKSNLGVDITASTTPNLFTDTAASVALTLRQIAARTDSPISAEEFAKLKTFLQKKAAKIAGSDNQPSVLAGLNAGFNGLNDGSANDPFRRYEDGTQPALTTVRDPETDLRNG
jgi:hypothetical protein